MEGILEIIYPTVSVTMDNTGTGSNNVQQVFMSHVRIAATWEDLICDLWSMLPNHTSTREDKDM